MFELQTMLLVSDYQIHCSSSALQPEADMQLRQPMVADKLTAGELMCTLLFATLQLMSAIPYTRISLPILLCSPRQTCSCGRPWWRTS